LRRAELRLDQVRLFVVAGRYVLSGVEHVMFSKKEAVSMTGSFPNPYSPTSVSELRSMIVAMHNDHSRAAQCVLTEAFRSPDLVAFGSAASVAKICGVSPSTVLRVARSFGFESFRDLRKIFRDEIKERAARRET
jgi:hypothetical protein